MTKPTLALRTASTAPSSPSTRRESQQNPDVRRQQFHLLQRTRGDDKLRDRAGHSRSRYRPGLRWSSHLTILVTGQRKSSAWNRSSSPPKSITSRMIFLSASKSGSNRRRPRGTIGLSAPPLLLLETAELGARWQLTWTSISASPHQSWALRNQFSLPEVAMQRQQALEIVRKCQK